MKGAAGFIALWPGGLNWHGSCGLVGRDASYAGALCKRNRFEERRFL